MFGSGSGNIGAVNPALSSRQFGGPAPMAAAGGSRPPGGGFGSSVGKFTSGAMTSSPLTNSTIGRGLQSSGMSTIKKMF